MYMYGNYPTKNTVCTPYIPMNVWIWPTLHIWNHLLPHRRLRLNIEMER